MSCFDGLYKQNIKVDMFRYSGAKLEKQANKQKILQSIYLTGNQRGYANRDVEPYLFLISNLKTSELAADQTTETDIMLK